ncbi:E3 ubiquitin-protein ligase ZNF598-like [Haliotis cracherodii]|uniref:E3 ubiquitin-protein ligase ZNF598-like n=1 Tax=Haliotis cracherodii TaxID=6455 RepID=UPI0039ECDAB7
MDTQDNTCSVCHEKISVFAIGLCDHPICFKCSTRMRVLCEQMYCAICRTDLPEVLFVKTQAKFSSIVRRNFIRQPKYKILFEDENVEKTYRNLQEYKCKVCMDRPSEKTFYALKDHMRKEHTLFCCDLCLKHLKLFSFERKFYNRRDLASHRRTGDEDDRSYKGHPLCHFCDERYMDKDELHRHLRKDHYFCHFCDEQSNEYYNDYADLKQHFRERHYMCEMDHCIGVQFTNVFRSEIDMKAHIAKEHHQRLNKAQYKETRTLDVNFQLPPRARGRDRGRGVGNVTSEDYEDTSSRGQGQGRGYRGRGYRGQDSGREREERAQMERAREASMQESLRATEKEMREVERKRHEAQEIEAARLEDERLKMELKSIERDFPSLSGNAPVPSIVPANVGKTNKKQSHAKDTKSQPMSNRIKNPGRLNSTEYPSLGGGSSSSSSQKMSHSNSSGRDSPVQNPVQTSVVPSSNIQTVPQSVMDSIKKNDHVVQKRMPMKTSDDFPSLGGGVSRPKNDSNVSLMSLGVWSGKSKKNEIQMDTTTNNKPQQSVPTSLASVGFSLCDRPFSAPISKKSQKLSAKSKTSNSNSQSQNTVKVPPPKTRDKEPPLASADSFEDVSSKKNKKKKKQNDQKEQTLVKPASADSGKDKKSKKSKSSDPVAKMFSEQNDRDSGIESSSGSVDASTPFKADEYPRCAATKTQMVTAAAVDMVQPASTPSYSSNTGATNGSLEGIAVGLLGGNMAVGASGTVTNGFNSDQKQPVLDDFPALNSPSSLAAPPPGFSSAIPPGFGGKMLGAKTSGAKTSGARPPPGFSSQSSDQSSKKKNAPLAPEVDNFVFSKPKNFSERNKELVQNVSILLCNDHDKFNKFKAYSGSFRQGSMNAAEYYKSCQELLDQENFDMIIPELIALLPDISKQQELLSVHREACKSEPRSSVLRISGKSTKAPWSCSPEFKSCPTCRQVLLQKDFDWHILEHGGPGDFPSLGNRPPHPSFLGQGSYIKAK